MTKLVIIKTNSIIPELGGIRGPINRPTLLTYDTIYKLLNRGVSVYEVNKRNPTEKVRLTRENVNKTNFFNTRKQVNTKSTSVTYKKTDEKIVDSIKKQNQPKTSNTNNMRNDDTKKISTDSFVPNTNDVKKKDNK